MDLCGASRAGDVVSSQERIVCLIHGFVWRFWTRGHVPGNEEHVGLIFLTIALPRGSHARYDFYLLNKKAAWVTAVMVVLVIGCTRAYLMLPV